VEPRRIGLPAFALQKPLLRDSLILLLVFRASTSQPTQILTFTAPELRQAVAKCYRISLPKPFKKDYSSTQSNPHHPFYKHPCAKNVPKQEVMIGSEIFISLKT
jgi:hypothetical protein